MTFLDFKETRSQMCYPFDSALRFTLLVTDEFGVDGRRVDHVSGVRRQEGRHPPSVVGVAVAEEQVRASRDSAPAPEVHGQDVIDQDAVVLHVCCLFARPKLGVGSKFLRVESEQLFHEQQVKRALTQPRARRKGPKHKHLIVKHVLRSPDPLSSRERFRDHAQL